MKTILSSRGRQYGKNTQFQFASTSSCHISGHQAHQPHRHRYHIVWNNPQTMAEVAESSVKIIASLPTYKLGEEGKPNHFNAATSREAAAVEAKSLEVGCAAFIKRSDLKWTYAVVTEKIVGDSVSLRFEVDNEHNRKSFPEAQWGKYIRVIQVEESELARLQAEADKEKQAEEKAAIKEDDYDIKTYHSDAKTTATSASKTGSWFSGLFTHKSAEAPPAAPAEVPAPAVAEEQLTSALDKVETEAAPNAVETVVDKAVEEEVTVEKSPVEETPAEETPVEEPEDSKENSDPKVESEPEPAKESFSPFRNPLNIKSALLNKIFKQDKTPPKTTEKKVVIDSDKVDGPPMSPKGENAKREWFDPDAFEVDYDTSPTDLFQALEARQFSYANEMFLQVYKKFNKDCKTWVVARGLTKNAQLRFRALPLHAALVFGAPDDMVMKILNAYPNATRGRDVKGRLPIHLAFEHNASEEVVASIIEVFPRGFFATDKKDKSPLDYVNGNMKHSQLKRFIPLILAKKVEDERAKWETELETALAEQKVALKSDKEYLEDVIATVTTDVEAEYASKIEMLDENYKKEILLLKKKHDSETQALLEGFEVKLNFERKLHKLKGKQ